VQNVVSYYEVAGASPADVRAALYRNGPVINQVPVFAMTEWEVSWRLRPATRLGECRLPRPDVQLTIRTILPRWKSAAPASAEMRSLWRSFLVAIALHEDGHKDLGLRAAAAVADTLRTFGHQRAHSCHQLISDADGAKTVLQHFYERNALYDEATVHGATQGVLWPPIQMRGTD
jgi:predicted secreted Zn-dependent protease